MSLILESLERAEAERKSGQTPDTGGPPESTDPDVARQPGAGRFWKFFAVAAGAGILAAVLWVTMSGKVPVPEIQKTAETATKDVAADVAPMHQAAASPGETESARASTTAESAVPAAKPAQAATKAVAANRVPASEAEIANPELPDASAASAEPVGAGTDRETDLAEPQPPPQPAAPAPAVVSQPAAAAAPSTLEPPQANTPIPSPPAAPLSAEPARPEAQIALPQTTATPSTQKPSQASASVPAATASPVAPAPALPTKAPVAAQPEVQNATPKVPPKPPVVAARPKVKQNPSGRIPLLRELPPEIQSRYQDLSLNVVVHEKNPSESLVFINLGQYREGDRIAGGGLRVERILPDGVVLDYGEGRFKLRMYQ